MDDSRQLNVLLAALRLEKKPEDIRRQLETFPTSINLIDKDGYTPLHNAQSSEAIDILLENRSEQEKKELLEKRDKWGRTALHMAYKKKKTSDIVEALVRHGAKVNVHDNGFNTPLHYIENLTAVKLLLKSGANPNLVNQNKLTPFGVRAVEKNWKEYKEFFVLLISYFASVRSNSKKQKDVLEFLFGKNSLHYACATLGCSPVEELLQLDSYKNFINQALHEITPLHMATSQSHLKLVILLVKNGAHVDQKFIQKALTYRRADIAWYLKNNITRSSQQASAQLNSENTKKSDQQPEKELPRVVKQVLTNEHVNSGKQEESNLPNYSICLEQPSSIQGSVLPPCLLPSYFYYYPAPVPLCCGLPPGLIPYGQPVYYPMSYTYMSQPSSVSTATSSHSSRPPCYVAPTPVRIPSPESFSFFQISPQTYIQARVCTGSPSEQDAIKNTDTTD